MKLALLSVFAVLLGGCVSTQAPAPVTRTIYVPADTQTVVVVREAEPVYYPRVYWGVRLGFGGGHHRPGPWRR